MRRLKEAVLRLLTSDQWPSRKSGLRLAQIMMAQGFGSEIDRTIEEVVKTQLQHNEARVREEAADMLGEWAKQVNGDAVWDRFGQELMSIVEDCEERMPVSMEEVEQKKKATSLRHDTEGWRSLESSLRAILRIIQGYNDRPRRDDIDRANTSLERRLTSYERMISNQRLFELILRLLRHQNRFVRETSWSIIGAIYEGGMKRITTPQRPRERLAVDEVNSGSNSSSARSSGGIVELISSRLDLYSRRVSEELAKGLLDDWSHVVYSASQAARPFVMYLKKRAEMKWNREKCDKDGNKSGSSDPTVATTLSSSQSSSSSMPNIFSLIQILSRLNTSPPNSQVPPPSSAPASSSSNPSSSDSDHQQDEYLLLHQCLTVLLPALCFNRYVGQDGLRSFSLQTWKMFVVHDGPALVSLYFDHILRFYHEMSNHHNATTRETAAYCLGELMKKISKARGHSRRSTVIIVTEPSTPEKANTGSSPSSSSSFSSFASNQDLIGDMLKRLAQDHSWPVRDAACSSIRLWLSFFETSPDSDSDSDSDSESESVDGGPVAGLDNSRFLSDLINLMEERLRDPLQAVRENAAAALIPLIHRGEEDEERRRRRPTRKITAGGPGGDRGDDGDDDDDDDDDEDDEKRDTLVDQGDQGDQEDQEGAASPTKTKSKSESKSKSQSQSQSKSLHRFPTTDSFSRHLLDLIESRLRSAIVQYGSLNQSTLESPLSTPSFNSSNTLSPPPPPPPSSSSSSILSTSQDQHLLSSGETSFGPASKFLHDNDPSLHSMQEIFSCECHATPHTCKSHPLTSFQPQAWEIAQGAMFLLRDWILMLKEKQSVSTSREHASKPSKKGDVDNNDGDAAPSGNQGVQNSLTKISFSSTSSTALSSAHQAPQNGSSSFTTNDRYIRSRLSQLVQLVLALAKSTKPIFSKFSTFMTSTLSVITNILVNDPLLVPEHDLSPLEGECSEEECHPRHTPKTESLHHHHQQHAHHDECHECSHSSTTTTANTNTTLTPSSSWASIVPFLFGMIEREEKMSVATVVRLPGSHTTTTTTTTTSRTPMGPLGPGMMMMNGPGFMGSAGGRTPMMHASSASPVIAHPSSGSRPLSNQSMSPTFGANPFSTPGGPHHQHQQQQQQQPLPGAGDPMTTRSLPSNPNLSGHLNAPHYAASISPSLAKASSSQLLIHAASQLLMEIYKLLGSKNFNTVAFSASVETSSALSTALPLSLSSSSSSSSLNSTGTSSGTSKTNMEIFKRRVQPLITMERESSDKQTTNFLMERGM